jgi:uncharacterized protein (TIGR03083 family)
MSMTETPMTAQIDPIGHREAMTLAVTAYARFADVVEALTDEDWQRPTDCTGWTVRDMVGHMVGAMRSAARLREFMSQQREITGRVKRDGGNPVDTMTQVQIDRTADLSTAELTAECRALVDRATAGRRRTPAPLRRFVTFPVEIGSIKERWRLGYLLDVILTRDAWLHRIDLCRAIAAEPLLTADHDGRIIADVAAEWARRHGQPHHLVLTGPAGGTFRAGDVADDARLEVDAVEFCRIVSGRAAGTGLLATEVPF